MGIIEVATRIRSTLALHRAHQRDMDARPDIPLPCSECMETVPAGGGHWFPYHRAIVCSRQCADDFQAAMF